MNSRVDHLYFRDLNEFCLIGELLYLIFLHIPQPNDDAADMTIFYMRKQKETTDGNKM